MQRLRDQLFADFRTVRLGRVDEIHAELDRALEDANRFIAILRRTPDAFAGDAHRAEAEPVDREIAADGESRFRHGLTLAERSRLAEAQRGESQPRKRESLLGCWVVGLSGPCSQPNNPI